ncbi:DUF951 domain-containing protein [Acholeplasma hippikon]|uniref:Bacterial protein of uncharacterized function (DUF951) n=1 Tax=Acholeplasma hippikon TaxID=264636 RepID=A0A449BKI4_9MOLU|nr:DUF951 domain-containing protein [Acholeplasma hippikon]VEU82985.1 Bacterial protein of uncharacterised function (DUF951) [Acholeplasma hippikon]
MIYTLGQIIETKKPHVCGNSSWEITRTGVDIKIKCVQCGREIMISKIELDKKIKNK